MITVLNVVAFDYFFTLIVAVSVPIILGISIISVIGRN